MRALPDWAYANGNIPDEDTWFLEYGVTVASGSDAGSFPTVDGVPFFQVAVLLCLGVIIGILLIGNRRF